MSDYKGLTHLNERGEPQMVDVSAKVETQRWATAEARLCMQISTLDLIMQGGLPKGDVLVVARLAGIQAAKKTSDLIPLCHPLALTSIDIEINEDRELPGLHLVARCGLVGRTGVEMEALTAVSLAALTIYDMCKAVDRSMHMTYVGLVEKQGGQRGPWRRP